MSRPFQHKVYYEGDTNENNHDNDDSKSDNNNLVSNLGKEKEYKEDDEWKEDYSMAAKTNKFIMR